MGIKKFVLSGMVLFIFICIISCAKNPAAAEPTPSTQPTDVSFTLSGTPSNNSVCLEEVSTSDDIITLAINVQEGVDVYGAILEITYDGAKISYVSSSEGSYLNQGGANTIFSANLFNNQEGTLLMGINREGIASGVNGDGTLATIVFKALSAQENTEINYNSTNSVLKLPTGVDISGTAWIGGKLTYK